MIKLTLNTLITVCSIFIILSCSNNDKKRSQQIGDRINTQKTQLENESNSKLSNEQSISDLSVEKIDLISIKKRFVKSYTSGAYSKKESENYLPNDQPAFYGVYYFINPDNPIPFIGRAVVACQDQDGWDYFNEQEELVEFSTFSNQLNPFIENLQIGQSKKELVKEFGDDFKVSKSNLVYSDKAGIVVNILMNQDTIQAIKVGKYEEAQKVRPIKLKW